MSGLGSTFGQGPGLDRTLSLRLVDANTALVRDLDPRPVTLLFLVVIPLVHPLALIVIFVGFASSRLGTSMVRTPLSNEALMSWAFAVGGSDSERVNGPKRRSTRWNSSPGTSPSN